MDHVSLHASIVNDHFRATTSYYIILLLLDFMLKNWPLSHANSHFPSRGCNAIIVVDFSVMDFFESLSESVNEDASLNDYKMEIKPNSTCLSIAGLKNLTPCCRRAVRLSTFRTMDCSLPISKLSVPARTPARISEEGHSPILVFVWEITIRAEATFRT